MKHVLFGQKAVFLDDDAADALIAYAGQIARMGSGDSVDMRGLNAEGNLVITTFLLNSGSNLTAETTDVQFDAPDNDEALAYIRARIDLLSDIPDFVEGFRVSPDSPVE